MSNAVVYQGRATAIRYKSADTNANAVYTCPSDYVARCVWLHIVNTDSVARNVTVTIVDAAAVSYTLYPTSSVAAAGVLDFDLSSHPLVATEIIKVQAGTANTIQTIGTIMETSKLQ